MANPPAEESRDVEMSEAPPAKELEQPEQPEQPVTAPQVNPTELEGLGEAPAETPKESVQEPALEHPKESLAADAKPEGSKSASTADETTEAAVPSAPVTDVEGGAEKAIEATPEKPSAIPLAAPADKAEAAEDASARMLAANLETPANGDAKVDISDNEPPAEEALKNGNGSPVVGEKRKADDDVGTNGDSSNKKSNIESAAEPPTTNGGTAPRKPGRPKKEKKIPAPVGKTARRTRSQGAADLESV